MSRRMIAACAAVACACGVAAAQPAEPAPAEPVPAEPVPAEPVPAEPVPAEPAPAEPAPAEAPPGALAPAPIEPFPAELVPVPEPVQADIGDQEIGGEIGLAAGGRTTAGGLRVTGHYLYQLSEQDWFDGIASFTFGSGDPACFRDRDDDVVCDHGLASGGAIEVAAGVRRMFAPQDRFRPFVRAAVGIALVRFGGDDVIGVGIPLHAGAGLRASVSPEVAIVALADATLGLAAFGGGVGGEPQLGLAITAGAEVRLR
jgi:hypothetical protein